MKRKVERTIEQHLAKARRIKCSVLVWGAGPWGGDLYEKRLQIINKLREDPNIYADSSDIDPPKMSVPARLSLRSKEIIQAQAYDVIVLMPCSRGSVAELHDILPYEQLMRKTFVLLDEGTLGDYSSKAVKERWPNQVETYNTDDLKACNLLRTVINFLTVLRYDWYKDTLRE